MLFPEETVTFEIERKPDGQPTAINIVVVDHSGAPMQLGTVKRYVAIALLQHIKNCTRSSKDGVIFPSCLTTLCCCLYSSLQVW